MFALNDLTAILKNLSFDSEGGYVGAVDSLIKHLGLRKESRTLQESYMWDGHSFNSELSDRHLFHDVAHWLVAAPERRILPDFGLGPGPETDLDLPQKILLDWHAAQFEEVCASLLGVFLQHCAGLPCGLIAEEVGLSGGGRLVSSRVIERDWLEAYNWLVGREHIFDVRACAGTLKITTQKPENTR